MRQRRLPPLHALRAFEAVARSGSIKAAADEMYVTPSAVSQQIKKLEEDLNVALLVRDNRNVMPTAEGLRLRDSLGDAFISIREGVESILATDEGADELVVTCGASVAAKWLIPRLGGFISRYPEVDIRVSPIVEFAAYQKEDVDVGIHLSSETSPNLEHTWLFEETVVALCSPEFASRHRLREPRDILRVPLLRHNAFADSKGPLAELWFAKAGLGASGARRGVHFEGSAELAINAALGGAGVVIAPKTLASIDLENSRLVIPFGPEVRLGLSYQFVERRTPRACDYLESFKTWVMEEFRSPEIGSLAGLKAA
ncbi:MAG: LysR substrate-binding domain-containing protein [Pseudomonadota bacterium]